MELGAIVLFTSRLSESAAFYRALGLPLEDEDHEAGPSHLVCDLGPTHFALFEAATAGEARPFRAAGSTMPGIAVACLDEAFRAVESLGAKIIQPPADYPWGPRFLVQDPDGRTVEVFERTA